MSSTQITNFEKVGDFMEAFGQEVLYIPTMPDFNLSALRLDLIEEEVQELRDGLGKKSMLEIADALTDILYVVYGAGHAFGIDLDDCFHEVHSSNMTKLGADGRPLYREDGKVMKGPNYREPDLTKFTSQEKSMKLRSQENTFIDLEDKIVAAWRTVDDLDTLYHSSESLSEDQLMNVLIGVREFHELRMKDLWRVFEQCLKARREECTK